MARGFAGGGQRRLHPACGLSRGGCACEIRMGGCAGGRCARCRAHCTRRIARGHVGVRGQGRARLRGVALDHVGVIALADPGQRVQRQAQAHRRIARHQVHALIAEEPGAGGPDRAGQAHSGAGLQRQHIADFGVKLLREHAAQPCPFHLVVQFGIERIDIDRQPALAPQVVPGVFKAGLHVLVGQAQLGGQRANEVTGIACGVVGRLALVGKEGGVVPDLLAVGAPIDVQRPARQLFAGVPLALAEMQKAAAAVLVAQLVRQRGRKAAFGRAQRVGVPLGGVAVVDGDKGRLAAHGQPHIAGHQFAVDLFAQGHDGGPLLFGVGLGDARRFVDARDFHVVAELDFALVDAAFYGGCAGRQRRAGQRDVAFTGQQARGRVQANPAGARQVHLGPGVQVGEVDGGAAGAVQGFDVGRQLDQIARCKTCRQAAVAQQLH